MKLDEAIAEGRLLTADEVAAILGVGVRYVWRLGRDGRLRRVKLGAKYVRFDPADVKAFIDEGRRPRGPQAARSRVERPGRRRFTGV